jgi:Protein of unknown function (DUF4232)
MRVLVRRPLAVVVGAALAAAMAAVPAGAGSFASVAGDGCVAGQLRASMPDIPGDPDGGPSQTVFNVVLVNVGGSRCSLRGWPGLTVRGPAGGPVHAAVTDVGFNNLGFVADRRTVLRPGQRAVVTLASPFRVRGCLTRWSLALRLPGAAGQVVAGGPPGAVLCTWGIQVSPVSPLRALRNAIGALNAPSKVAFPSMTASEPPLCPAGALRTGVASVTARPGGSIVVLRLSAGQPCTIRSGGWPTVRLTMSGGASPMAKAYSYGPAWGAARSSYMAYTRGRSQQTAVPLRPGSRVSVALLSAGRGACRRVVSATVYPTGLGLGPGADVTLPRPVRFCGQPRVLPFLPGGPAAGVLSLARRALSAARAGRGAAAASGGDSPAGFWYGSDGPLFMACGTAPYQIKGTHGDCTSTKGNYGGYLGEIGKWDRWKGCDSGGLAWNRTDFNDANTNKTAYRKGVGAAAYWLMAGPGRDPHPASKTAATAWGQAQAKRAALSLSPYTLVFGYVFMDIERDTYRHLFLNGWNEAWPSTCATTGAKNGIAPAIDRAAFNGFRNYIRRNTPWLPGVYSSGACCGSVSYEWNGIFTSAQTLSNTAEWTYNAETSSIATFPTGFTSPIRAHWFASAPSRCHYLWQWTGGTTRNGIIGFRVDQINGNRANHLTCA